MCAVRWGFARGCTTDRGVATSRAPQCRGLQFSRGDRRTTDVGTGSTRLRLTERDSDHGGLGENDELDNGWLVLELWS